MHVFEFFTFMKLRILLVDDHELVRMGLKTLLDRYPQFKVVGEAGNAEDAYELAMYHQPDIVVMDIRLQGKNGIVATREIVRDNPRPRRSSCSPPLPTTICYLMPSAGASGCVLKQIDGDDLVRALETVGRGDSMLDPAVTRRSLPACAREHRRDED